jgi:hypothetical protein
MTFIIQIKIIFLILLEYHTLERKQQEIYGITEFD